MNEEPRKPLKLPRDLERWMKENPLYEDLKNHATDNEYLFYINHKLRYANTALDGIKTMLWWLVFFVALAVGQYLGWWEQLRRWMPS